MSSPTCVRRRVAGWLTCGAALAILQACASFGGPAAPPGCTWPTGRWVGPNEPFGAGAHRMTDDDAIEDPVLLRKVDPKYTSRAMQAKVTGEVFLEVVILPDGAVGDVRVTKSLDADLGLDAMAVCAASGWRFRAAAIDGRPVAVIATLILEFRLH